MPYPIIMVGIYLGLFLVGGLIIIIQTVLRLVEIQKFIEKQCESIFGGMSSMMMHCKTRLTTAV